MDTAHNAVLMELGQKHEAAMMVLRQQLEAEGIQVIT